MTRPLFVLEGVYALVDTAVTPDAERFLDAILAGGVRLIQLRAKQGVERALLRALLARTRPAGALLIVNDDLDAALEADGLHAGQEDLEALRRRGIEAAALRATLAGKVLGVSCGLPGEALRALAEGADYVGTGPFKTTATKSDAGDAIGVAGLAAVCSAVPLPVAAIGGIDFGDLPEIAGAGARMVALVSALARAADPERRAREFVAGWARVRA